MLNWLVWYWQKLYYTIKLGGKPRTIYLDLAPEDWWFEVRDASGRLLDYAPKGEWDGSGI